MLNIAVLASGNGSNFEAIARAVKEQRLKAFIKFLITDKEDSFVRQRADKYGIKNIYINPKDFNAREDFDHAVAGFITEADIDLIVFAGYMRIVSSEFIERFKGRIINIHPSLLPKFKGMHAIKKAYESGEKITGVTVHYVSPEIDSGPIIEQIAVEIKDGMSLEDLEEQIHASEHILYPKVISDIAAKKVD
ncbi:MAG: phosphoribosylglycinamide formyltransferase [Candidatus Omnitrophica bacterium]|nr:phosphoribosylglycinamide formyltransferase [Candidatus Omnitrophota bacterium]MDD5080666.1 phosphoribosylglycinamide formyltransferase [Candidatus Omnitrophota bacterium]